MLRWASRRVQSLTSSSFVQKELLKSISLTPSVLGDQLTAHRDEQRHSLITLSRLWKPIADETSPFSSWNQRQLDQGTLFETQVHFASKKKQIEPPKWAALYNRCMLSVRCIDR